MSDTRAAIRELRSLSEKRSTQGLTETERSRLAELRERLGLPSEPAEVRAGGTEPGGTPAPRAAPAPLRPAPSPGNGTPVAAAPLPSFESAAAAPSPAVEATPVAEVESLVEAPASMAEPVATEMAGDPLEASLDNLGPAPLEDPLPILTSPAQVTRFEAAVPPAEAATDPAIDLHGVVDAIEPPPAIEASAEEDPLAELEALSAEAAAPPSDPVEATTFEAAGASADDGSAWTSALMEVSTEPVDAVDPEPAPARRSLAERIDAAVEAGEPLETGEGEPAEAAESAEPGEFAEPAEPAEAAESTGWGAMPVGTEPLVPEDLGATPLDVADPAAEFGLDGDADAAPIELSSADVILLEPETDAEAESGAHIEPELPAQPDLLAEPAMQAEPDLEAEISGEPADPVPLAEMHEFVGEQPFDPRALAFDDQGGEPTFSPEDLQASEAELAADPQAFQPGELEGLPELDPEPPPPPPAPAAPRIVVPRPPPAAPAQASAPPARQPPPPPPAPPPAAAPRAVVAPTAPRPATPPPPPAAAYVMSEDGRRLPGLTPARPEPPHLAHQFANSGPFVRNKTVLLAQAPLDVMEDAEGLVPEPPPPPPPPVTDVATGAEVFGGAYLSPTFVEGEHRVVLHTLEGQVRRGTVKDVDLLDPVIRLAQPGRPPEAIAAERVKAIFFMQEPGSPPPASRGRRIRVGFSDGRQIVGFSEDVDGGEQGFFLVPADTRTHTARIYVFRAGIASITAA